MNIRYILISVVDTQIFHAFLKEFKDANQQMKKELLASSNTDISEYLVYDEYSDDYGCLSGKMFGYTETSAYLVDGKNPYSEESYDVSFNYSWQIIELPKN